MSMTVAQQKVKIKHTGSHLRRIRGVGLYYSNDIHGVPAVLMQTARSPSPPVSFSLAGTVLYGTVSVHGRA